MARQPVLVGADILDTCLVPHADRATNAPGFAARVSA